MKYGVEKDGVKLERDCFAQQFAEPGDIQYNYRVYVHGSLLEEDEDPKVLARRLEKVGARLLALSNFLKKRAPKGPGSR